MEYQKDYILNNLIFEIELIFFFFENCYLFFNKILKYNYKYKLFNLNLIEFKKSMNDVRICAKIHMSIVSYISFYFIQFIKFINFIQYKLTNICDIFRTNISY